ncbi:DUF6069 family protein [Georgenia sp. TF02-10]|uniref:DUF6069 family protein n=1 Tax=Georgenia sp. TF02-10 TaxID=2917725 RepID=UPI001FA7006E|nr:DUF6069 family protein [Georgenia sp. TF02-10]UNX53262.1 DUF6069 family protein [Georgenia sp. TF02-10]
MTKTTDTSVSSSPGHGVRRRRVTAAATILAAAAAGLLAWAVAAPLAGVPLVVPGAGQAVGSPSVVVAALVGGAAAWLLLVVLRRFRRGLTAWTVIAGSVLAVSLAGPPLSGVTGAALLVLEVMHVVVGGILIGGLRLSEHAVAGPSRTVGAEE